MQLLCREAAMMQGQYRVLSSFCSRIGRYLYSAVRIRAQNKLGGLANNYPRNYIRQIKKCHHFEQNAPKLTFNPSAFTYHVDQQC